MGFLDFKGGMIAINTGQGPFGVITHRFGSSLRTDEAHEIVELILTRFPKYEYGPLRLS